MRGNVQLSLNTTTYCERLGDRTKTKQDKKHSNGDNQGRKWFLITIFSYLLHFNRLFGFITEGLREVRPRQFAGTTVDTSNKLSNGKHKSLPIDQYGWLVGWPFIF